MLTLLVLIAVGAIFAQELAAGCLKRCSDSNVSGCRTTCLACIRKCQADAACIRACVGGDSTGDGEGEGVDACRQPADAETKRKCCAKLGGKPAYCGIAPTRDGTPTRGEKTTGVRSTRDNTGVRPTRPSEGGCDRDCLCYRCKAASEDLSAEMKKRCASLRCPDIKVDPKPKVDICASDNLPEAAKLGCCIARNCASVPRTTADERSVVDIRKCAQEKCQFKAPEEPKCDGAADCCKSLYARGIKTEACAKFFTAINNRRGDDKPKDQDDTTLENEKVRERVKRACNGENNLVCCAARALSIKEADKKAAAIKACREKFAPNADKECDASLKCNAEADAGVRAYCVKRCKHDVDTTVVPPSVDCDIKGASSVRACVCKTERGAKLDACAERVLGDDKESCREKAGKLAKDGSKEDAIAAFRKCVAGEDSERKEKIVAVKDGDKIGSAEVDAAKDPESRCKRAISERVRNLIKTAKESDGEKKFDSIGLSVSSMVKSCVARAKVEAAKAKADAKKVREAKSIDALKKIVEANKEAKERRAKYIAKLRDAAKKFQAATADAKAALKAAREECSKECEDADCKKACFKKAVVAEFKDVPCSRFEAFRERVKALDTARKAAKKFKRVFGFFNRVCAPKASADEEAKEDGDEEKKEEKRQAEETVTFTVTVTGEDADEAATVVANLPGDGTFVEGTDTESDASTTDPTAKPTEKVTDAASSASSVLMTFAAIAVAICALF